jgi:uncharacterized OB-fold protein
MTDITFPRLVRLYGDQPFWDSIKARRMALQRCRACAKFRYPAAPVCPACFAEESDWVPVSGKAELLSWAIFHRKYLPSYPPPHNVIVARLAEGPSMVSYLAGDEPYEGCIGKPLQLVYEEDSAGVVLPLFRFA